jgi:demethylmenaquinone methyltransferase / 2-methoxy-6-polyprenyl-1,4-benzoquinol methylase
MFDSIAHRYDLLNHTLSSGIDILWRKRVIRLLAPYKPQHILDVATGTADLAIAASTLQPTRIIGIDISPQMLEIGKRKIRIRKLDHKIELREASAEHIPFPSKSFDAVIAAFGVRNFEDLEKGLMEFHRVLAKNGVAIILEFSKPVTFPIKQLYAFYSKTLLPTLGGMISRNREAYRYLPDTVTEFPDGEAFCGHLKRAGFATTKIHRQTFGIATIYIGIKEN